jgi:hypothetical protein
MFRPLLLIFALGTSVLVPSAWGALFVDINDATANNANLTQPGFQAVVRTGATGLASDIGTVDIVFAPSPGSGTLDDRDRGGPATNPAQPLARLARDFVFSGGVPHPTAGVDTSVTGLNAGSYLLTTYHHDATVAHHTTDIELSVDGGATFMPMVQDALISTGANPAEIGHASAPFTIAGGQTLVFRMIGDGGQGTTLPGPAVSETAILSGFVIEPFTELGDFNGMGGVTAADFLVLSGNLGTHLDGNYVGHAGGDMNLDGRVDLDDFGQFKASFPGAFAAAMAMVPEPSSLVIGAMLAAGGLMGSRRYRRRLQ